MTGGDLRTLKTVERSCTVLRALKRHGPTGVTELADRLDISNGCAYNHLATLRENELVVKRDGKYCLGLQFLNFGEYVRNQHPLYVAGVEETERLARETEEFVYLLTEEFGRGIYLHKAAGERAIAEEFHTRKFERRDYLHYSAAGKAILAWLPHERLESIVDRHGLPRRTSHTIVDREELFQVLDTVRERGYALDDEEEVRGMRAVSAPILSPDGDVTGAISLTGPKTRMSGELFHEELPRRVMRAANLVEVELEISGQLDAPTVADL